MLVLPMGLFHTLIVAATTLASLVTIPAMGQSQAPLRELSSYQLGSDDQVTIRVVEAEEIPDKPFRIDEQGNISLPMIGVVHAAGLTVRELRTTIENKLRAYIRQPQVTIFVSEMRSQPVSIVGAVNAPGVQQLQGHKSLIEVLSLAGGLKADAGFSVKITRRLEWGPIPLSGVQVDEAGQFSVAEVSLKSLLEAKNPAENIAIMPNDVLTVPSGEMVYVVGDVKKSGGFVLGARRTVSVLQALAMAEGLTQVAKASDSKILRTIPGTDTRREIPVDLKKIMAGQATDVSMEANDILFVPANGARNLGVRAIESMFSIGTGLAIYRPF